jgi:hypothetical protein
MGKKVLALVFFFGLIIINIALVSLYYSNSKISGRQQKILSEIDGASSPQSQFALSAAPLVLGAMKDEVTVADGRIANLQRFFRNYGSPLFDYAEYIVQASDKYHVDYRLYPAIAMQESNLCKKIPEGTYNCLGFGIHERGTLGFEAYEAGFERAAKELKERYINKGLDTPEKIMRKYTPSSKGSWAASVTQWMNEMRYDDRKLGQENRTDKVHVLEFVGDATPAASSSPSARPLERL